MIRFFRKIRQKLITENIFSKYMLYAIGEIILVVVGILIALQINTWNENSKQTVEERRILANLRTDFISDTIQLGQNIRATIKRDSALSEILEIIALKGDFDTQKFVQLSISNIPFFNYFNVNSGAFDESIAAGSIKVISNKSLRQHIFNYYRVTKLNSIDNEVSNSENEVMNVFFEKIITSKEVMEMFGAKNRIPNLDIALLGEDVSFVSKILKKLGDQSQQQERWKSYLARAEKGIELINGELGE